MARRQKLLIMGDVVTSKAELSVIWPFWCVRLVAEYRFFAKSKLYSDSDPQISAQSRGPGCAAAKVQRVRGGGTHRSCTSLSVLVRN